MSRFVYLKNREACVVDCGSHSQQSLLRVSLLLTHTVLLIIFCLYVGFPLKEVKMVLTQ